MTGLAQRTLTMHPFIISSRILQPHSQYTHPTLPAPFKSPPQLHPNQSNTASTNLFSNLPTSLLNPSTSSQQSNGLRSLSLKHFTSFPFALSTPSSPTTSSFGFLFSSFRFSASISFCTVCLPRSLLSLLSLLKADWKPPEPVAKFDWSRERAWEEGSVESGSEGAEGSCERRSESSFSWRVCSASRRLSSAVTRDWMWSSRS